MGFIAFSCMCMVLFACIYPPYIFFTLSFPSVFIMLIFVWFLPFWVFFLTQRDIVGLSTLAAFMVVQVICISFCLSSLSSPVY